MSTEKNNGASKGQEHYIKSALQPIQFMQKLMPKDKFEGFLEGNIIKYDLRAGNKDDKSKDIAKRNQYAYWLDLARLGVIIDPIKDSVPNDYEFKGLL